MAVLDLQHVGRQRVGGETVDEVSLRLEEPLRGGLPVRPLEVVTQADKARVLLESIHADDDTTRIDERQAYLGVQCGVRGTQNKEGCQVLC